MTTYLLVHGGWSGGWYWTDVARHLETLGHRTLVIDQLPSAGRDPSQLGGLHADAEAVRRALDDAGEPVVLVGHSSAGIVISEVVISEVADHPSIAHTVYLAAFWLPRGKSLIDMLGAGPPPDWWSVRDDGAAQVSDDIEVVREALCADADPQLAEAGIRRLVLQAVASFTTPSAAPDRTHPTTYIILENDGAVPPAAQEQMAAAADHIERLPSSHQPMISMPDRLAQVLAQVR
jgi:pimeloyl-ACP methyl ester carboxylesterase